MNENYFAAHFTPIHNYRIMKNKCLTFLVPMLTGIAESDVKYPTSSPTPSFRNFRHFAKFPRPSSTPTPGSDSWT